MERCSNLPKKNNDLGEIKLMFLQVCKNKYNSFSFLNLAKFLIKDGYTAKNINVYDLSDQQCLEIIKQYNPKVIFLKDYQVISEELLKFLKKIKIKLIVSVGFPIPINFYKYFDFILFRNKELEYKYSKYTKFNKCIYHSIDEEAFKNILNTKFKTRKYLITFAGSIQSNTALNHYKRYNFLYNLLKKKYPLKVFANEINSIYDIIRFYNFNCKNKYIYQLFIYILKKINFVLKKIRKKNSKIDILINDFNIVKNLDNPLYKGPLKNHFPKSIYNAKFDKDYFKILENSKLSLNIHTDIAGKIFNGNIRCFEATASGSALIVEKKQYLDDCFSDNEVITYTNFEDLCEKIDYFNKNIDTAETIAKLGRKRTLNDHTHKCRYNQIKNDIFNMF